jgi:hypothetical protein
MRLGFRYVLFTVFSLAMAGASPASAQDGAWGISASAMRLDYDLSGVGNAPGLTVRATRDLSSNVSLEFGGSFARPDQQFVGRSTLFMPEAQLRYRWNVGRVSPHVGGGLGAAMVKSPFHTDWDPTLSVAAGTSVRLTERLSAVGELRVRGHEWRFTGTTSELAAGLAWQLPSF